MKHAKNEFDSLVERIRNGEDISFGKIEKLFAEAFMRKFLKRITTDKHKEKANQLYREWSPEEYDDEGEELTLSREQLNSYNLELARFLSGTLGIRPTAGDLSEYIKAAIEYREWNQLNKILSLTQDTDINSAIEKAALEDLANNRSNSYDAIKEHFPELKFTKENVLAQYEKLLENPPKNEEDYRDFSGLARILDETKIHVPKELIQKYYEEKLAHEDMAYIVSLFKHTRIRPEFTNQIIESLESYLEHCDYEYLFEDITEIFDLVSGNLSKQFQQNLLACGDYYYFHQLYENSPDRISNREVLSEYSKLSSAGDLESVMRLLDFTEIVPSKNVLKNLYTHLLNENHFDRIEDVMEKTGTQPSFKKKELKEYIKKKREFFKNPGGYENVFHHLQNTLKFLKLAGEKIDPEFIKEGSSSFLDSSLRTRRTVGTSNFNEDLQKVEDLFKEYKVPMTPELNLMRIVGTVIELSDDMSNAYQKCRNENHRELSPIQPVQGRNIVQYNKFKNNINKKTRQAANKIEKLKKISAPVEGHFDLQCVYEMGLRLAFAQSLRGEKKPPAILGLADVLGIQITEENVISAFHNFFRENHENYESATGLLERFKENTGFTIDNKKLDEIAFKAFDPFPSQILREVTSTIAFLGAIGTEFSDETKQRINHNASCILENAVPRWYEPIFKYAEIDKLNEKDTERLKSVAIDSIVDNKKGVYEGIQEFAPSILENLDYRSIGAKLLAKGKYERYDQLKKEHSFDADFTDKEKEEIRAGVITKVKSVIKEWDSDWNLAKRLEFLNETSERVGFKIKATAEELRDILKCDTGKFPGKIAELLEQDFTTEYVTEKCLMILSENTDIWDKRAINAKSILESTKTKIMGEKLDEFLRNKIVAEQVPYLIKFSKATGYVPSDDILGNVFEYVWEECMRNELSQIIEYTGKAPPEHMIEEIIDRSLSSRFEPYRTRDSNDAIAKELVEKTGYSLSPDKINTVRQDVAQYPGNFFEVVTNFIAKMVNIYKTAPLFTKQEQESLLERLDSQIIGLPYSKLKKKNSYTNRYDREHERTAMRFVFRDPEVRKKAAKRAAEMLSTKLYHGFTYFDYTRVEPEFTPEQYDLFKEKIKKHGYRLNKSDLKQLDIEAWRPKCQE